MSAWTPERRRRQAELIQTWRPWEKSTGPQTEEGKARAARNAWKGGRRPELRELVKSINQALRSAREALCP